MIAVNDCWDRQTHRTIVEYASSWLWRNIRSSAMESEAEELFLNLTKLSPRELRLLADIRWLLSDSVQMLIWDIAPKIINRLSKTSVSETVTDRNKIKGRMNWSKTAIARIAAGGDQSLFVYSQRAQILGLPENRLFLHLLQKANEAAKSFVSDDYAKLTWYAESGAGSKWTEKVSIIASRTEKMLKTPIVSKISGTREITSKLISAAAKCRQTEYRTLAAIAGDYLTKQSSPVIYLHKELKGNILEPLNKDSLYEIAILFKTMAAAEESEWTEIKAGLIGGSSETVSIYKKDNAALKIYTQHIPAEFRQHSAYGQLMNCYGLSERLRRPDIVLEIESDGNRQFLIVEVKRSRRRSYLADGSYKLLGYLKDFEKVRENTPLFGFLVGWDGIADAEYQQGSEVGLFTWENYSDGIQAFLSGIGQSASGGQNRSQSIMGSSNGNSNSPDRAE